MLTDTDWQHIYNIDTDIYTARSAQKYYIKQHTVVINNYILKHEYDILQHIKQYEQQLHIQPSCIYDYYEYKYNTSNNTEYLAVQYYEPYCCLNSIKIDYTISQRICDTIHILHQYGILYNDVKLEHTYYINNTIHFIDFNLATYVKDTVINDDAVTKYNCGYFRGSVECSSINTHIGESVTYATDYESLIYLLLHCMQYELPWLNDLYSIDSMLDSDMLYVHHTGNKKIQYLYKRYNEHKLQYIIDTYIEPLIVAAYNKYTNNEQFEQYCYGLMCQCIQCLFDTNHTPYITKRQPPIYVDFATLQKHCHWIDSMKALKQWLCQFTPTTAFTIDMDFTAETRCEIQPLYYNAVAGIKKPTFCLFEPVDLSLCRKYNVLDSFAAALHKMELLLKELMQSDRHPYTITRYTFRVFLMIKRNIDFNIYDIVSQFASSHYNLLYPRIRVLGATGNIHICDDINGTVKTIVKLENPLDVLVSAASA